MSANTLHRLLDHSLRFPPEYADGLSSHLPMALHALEQLGADDDRLRAFFDRYVTRFDACGEVSAAQAVPAPSDWAALRGRFDAFETLRAGFADRLRTHGIDATLHQTLSLLWPGIAAAAFHGPIRTAHAVQTGHEGEIAAALAYWAARWQPMDAQFGRGAGLSFDDWAGALEAAVGRWQSGQRLISACMDEARASAPFRALAGRLAPAPDTLARLSDWAAAAYAASGNFTVLHMVTGCRAARVLLPWAGDPAAVLDALVPAFAAAALASGFRRGETVPLPLPSWQQVTAAALRSDDEHAIKLVHACVEQSALRDRGPWRAAAARATG